jgi:hypothetical protein
MVRFSVASLPAPIRQLPLLSFLQAYKEESNRKKADIFTRTGIKKGANCLAPSDLIFQW